MYKPPTFEPRYAWDRVQTQLDKFVNELGNQGLYVAWMKAQLIIEAQARFYAHVGNTVEDSVAMAWEDFEMACRGRGEPGITGAIFHLWSRLPSKNDKGLKAALERGFLEAYYATAPAARRYRDKDYKAKVHTLADGFDDPEAMPISIMPVAEAPKSANSLRDRINSMKDFKSSPFEVIEGGEGKPVEDDVF